MIGPSSILTECLSFFIMKSGYSSRSQHFVNNFSSSISSILGLILSNSLQLDRIFSKSRSVLKSNLFLIKFGSSEANIFKVLQRCSIVSHLM